MSANASPPLPPNASSQMYSSSITNIRQQVPLVPQIAPWTQYMRQPGKEPILPSIRSLNSRIEAVNKQAAVISPPAMTLHHCDHPTNTIGKPMMTSNGSASIKRHNPYAVNKSGASSCAGSSSLQNSVSSGKSPNATSFDLYPSAGSIDTINNSNITNTPYYTSNHSAGALDGALHVQQNQLDAVGSATKICTPASSVGSRTGYSSCESLGRQLSSTQRFWNTDAPESNRAPHSNNIRVGHERATHNYSSNINGTANTATTNANANRPRVSLEELRRFQGSLLEMAFTPHGSLLLQSAIRGPLPVNDLDPATGEQSHAGSAECVNIISAELMPSIGDLLLDQHGCYIIKTLMEKMPKDELQSVVDTLIAPSDSLVSNLCTHSLHTRRVVQFLFDSVDCSRLIKTVAARCNEIAATQQGCIIVQRAVDSATSELRKELVVAILSHFNSFCYDPYANYVLQHVLVACDSEEIAREVWPRIKGNILTMSCNKFASNVVEKCLSIFPSDLQHELLKEMYDVPEEKLLSMLQDSFGNYIVQSSIALAPFKEIAFMRTKLQAVLDRAPYGHKIESKLEKRRRVPPKAGEPHVVSQSPSVSKTNATTMAERENTSFQPWPVDETVGHPFHSKHRSHAEGVAKAHPQRKDGLGRNKSKFNNTSATRPHRGGGGGDVFPAK